MGELNVQRLEGAELRRFARALLRDVEALDAMLSAGAIQSGHRRVGCEQELFLVDELRRPKPVAFEMLAALDDAHFTTELGLFNLEVNQDSLPFTGNCLSRMEGELTSRLATARKIAARSGTELVMAGILPTLSKSDLGLDNMTPLPRYQALNDAMRELGGGRYELRLTGADELIVMQDSVMLESCCTSFQIHYQTDPEDFVRVYNLAQAMTAPVLAVSVNSPLLFGRRLWQETRVPLFQQSLDTRRAAGSLRERSARVTFGERWLEGSVVELFRDEIARLPIILGTHVEEDSLESYRHGSMPSLRALQIHNGTVYRWNRPCYGVQNGTAHLRIENRVLPAGPTVRDEVANAAFFWGLLYGMPRVHSDVGAVMEFEHARLNFLSAARSGLDSQFRWIHGTSVSVRDLVLDELLPIARTGLSDAGLKDEDIHDYLGVIEDRVSSGQTGAAWTMASMASMRAEGRETSQAALTAAIVDRQWGGTPGHLWPLARPEERSVSGEASVRVEEAMTTDLLTIRPDEPVEMAKCLMEWRNIRHLPVEDAPGKLAGILSRNSVVDSLSSRPPNLQDPVPVREIMDARPRVIGPEQSLRKAAESMKSWCVDYLVVIDDGHIAGILTDLDIRRVAPDVLRSGP